MICPNCGTENPEKNRFCQACGTPLAEADSAPPPTPAPPRPAEAPGPSTAPPVATVSTPPATPPSRTGKTHIDRMGDRIDGWADLIENAGDRADTLFQFVQQRLGERGMPAIAHYDQTLTVGGLISEQRRYHLVLHQVGAAIAVYVSGFGRDLYVSWDLFISQIWKPKTILIILAVAGVISFPGFIGLVGGDRRNILVGLFLGFMAWLFGTIMNTIGISILVGVAGLVLKRSFWGFFREEYNHFRADDITAMTLAVHHSLLEGLDSIGVDRALIRPKEQFRAGRRERII
jgi:hypothetical protein